MNENKANDQINEYNIDEYFLYDSFMNDNKNFIQMIGRFFRNHMNEVLDEIKKQSNKKLTNKEFYNIYSKYVQPKTIEEKQLSYDKIFKESGSRQEKFTYYIDKLFELTRTKLPDSEHIIYLDYGCNDGEFALAITKHFNILPKNVYCIDIIDKPYIVNKAGFNYIKLDLNDVEKSLSQLPEINLVTIINVIHHIPPENRDSLLKILNKKIKSKAHIIIKEHDCGPGKENHKFLMYISEWHKMYKALYQETDMMGRLYLMNISQLSAYMHLLDAFLKKAFHEKPDDILKAYYAMFIKK